MVQPAGAHAPFPHESPRGRRPPALHGHPPALQTYSQHPTPAPLPLPAEHLEHPQLPYIPAFKVGDIVYGTVSFTGPSGARCDIMYHEGLSG